jgi:hypothetical protein
LESQLGNWQLMGKNDARHLDALAGMTKSGNALLRRWVSSGCRQGCRPMQLVWHASSITSAQKAESGPTQNSRGVSLRTACILQNEAIGEEGAIAWFLQRKEVSTPDLEWDARFVFTSLPNSSI